MTYHHWKLVLILPLVMMINVSSGQTQIDSLLQNYDKSRRPNAGGSAVDVGVTMYFLEVSKIDSVAMEWEAIFYFRQTWKDLRLQHSGPGDIVTGLDDLANRVWRPDTFFVNSRRLSQFEGFTKLSPDGSMLVSVRMSVVASCPMDMGPFPFDTQTCTMEIESFGSDMRDIQYMWAKGKDSVGLSNSVSLPNWRVESHRESNMEVSLTSGNYSRIAVELTFSRGPGYYVASLFVPTGLLIILSWIPLWLPHDDRGYIGIGVNTAITVLLTACWVGTNASLPKISYVKASDIWFLFCIFLQLATLIGQLITAHVTSKTPNNDNKKDVAPVVTRMAYLLPWILRIVFPSLFVIFNLVYWCTYL